MSDIGRNIERKVRHTVQGKKGGLDWNDLNMLNIGGSTESSLGFDLGDPFGKNKGAAAAQAAAMAQLTAAREARSMIETEGRRVESEAMDLAAATPQELAALDRAYSSAESALTREEKLVAAIDPSIMEASKQALSLLKGETADINKPLTAMRTMQRQKLVDQLREQYGPGAETSSLGQKVLQNFDLQSDALFQQNQQNTLGQVFGIASTDLGGRLTRGQAAIQQVGQGYSALQQRQLNAKLQAGGNLVSALGGASGPVIQAAGAPYVGDALKAQSQGQIANLAATGLGYYFGGPAGAAVANQATNSFQGGSAIQLPANNYQYGDWFNA